MKSANQFSANLAGSARVALLAIVTLMAATVSSMAGNVYWSNGSADSTWATAGNWNSAADGSGATGVPGTTDTAYFNISTLNTAQTITLASALTVGRLVFNNTSTTGLGNSSATTDYALTIGSGGLTVNSGAGAVSFLTGTKIIVPYLGANQIWANNSINTLTIGKSLNLNGFALTLDCGGPITFLAANNITGAGGIIKQGANTLSIGSTPLFTGGLTVKAGMVTSSGSAAASIYGNGTVTLGDGGSGGGSATLQATTANAGIANAITVASGSSGTLTIQSANSAAVTFAGAITLNNALTLDAISGSAATFSGAITGSATITKGANGGTVTIKNANAGFSGNVNVNGGILKIDAGAGGALNSSSSTLTFGSTGTFNYDNTNTTLNKAQSLGALTFTAGDGTVQVTRTNGYSVGLTFSSLAARTAGAARNFVYAGTPGTIGTDSTITLTGTAVGFLDQGSFVGGSAYAWMNAAGTYPRAMVYGSDAGAVTSGATTTLADATHQQITGAISGQNTATFTTLNISGNFAFTLAASRTVTVNGILKSGNVTGGATISGGTGIQAASGVEMVIRTDGVNDALTVSTPILANGASALTKSGAGTLTLSSAGNTYTGDTTVSAGTLILSGSGVIASGNIIISGGATLDVSAVTYTLSTSQTLKGPSAGTGIIKAGAGGLTMGSTTALSLPNYAPGTNGLLNVTGGALTLASGNPVTVTIKNGGVALAAGNYKLISKGTGGSVAGTAPTSVTVNGAGSDGIASGTAASLSIISGELYLVVATPTAIATTTTVGSSANPSTYGQSVTFTATIAPVSGAVVPTGTVQFKTNSVACGLPVTVTTGSSPNGTAAISIANLPVTGSPHTITAEYTASGSFTSSTGTLSPSQTVNKVTPTISGVAASQSISYGTANVTLSGTVSAGSGYPANGETVSVTVNGSSQNATIAGGAGGFSVSFPTATLPPSASAYTITYAYVGNANLNAAANNTSTALTVTGIRVPALAYANAPGIARIITVAEIQTAGLASSQESPAYSITVGATSNGGTVITNGAGTMIKYTNSASFVPASDSFNYTVSDGAASATATVTLTFASVAGPQLATVLDGANHPVISFHGIPGFSYHIQRASALSPADWADVQLVPLDGNGDGSASWTDTSKTVPPDDVYYRLSYP